MEKRLRDSGALFPCPTYTITTVAGNTETHEHDAGTSVTTDADKIAWDLYQAGQEHLSASAGRRRRRCSCSTAHRWARSLSGWEQMAALGIDLPSDANDLLYEYLQIEILKTPEDIISASTPSCT